jgi:hypothetical protein
MFKEYAKTHNVLINTIFVKFKLMNSEELEHIINVGEYEGLKFTKSMFNISCNVKLINNFKKEYVFKEFKYDNFNLTIIADLDYDESVDKLYYYRLVATKIQKSRKLAGLHPWDLINAYYSGNTLYPLDNIDAQKYINNITRITFTKYSNQTCSFEYEFDELKIHLEIIK